MSLADDPRSRPIRRDGDSGQGCLLVHGLTGTPDEVRPVAERLADRGWTVRAPLLPGHGTTPEELLPTSRREWLAAVESEWDALRARVRGPAALVGVSMGALLCLHLAGRRPQEIASVVALSPALRLATPVRLRILSALSLLPWLPKRVAIVPKGEIRRVSPAYSAIPLRSIRELFALQEETAPLLGRVEAPVLVVVGDRDRTIHRDAGDEVLRGLPRGKGEILRVAGGEHVLTDPPWRDQVVESAVSFLASNLKGPRVSVP